MIGPRAGARPIISVTPRKNAVLRPLLVPTGRSFSSSFAPPARRGPADANAFRTIILRKGKANLPGMILLHKTTVRPGPSSRADNVSRGNNVRICTLEEDSSRQGRAGKPFKMISLYDSKNNLPGMILLRKKWGYPPAGALSLPKWLLSREAKSSRAPNQSGGPL